MRRTWAYERTDSSYSIESYREKLALENQLTKETFGKIVRKISTRVGKFAKVEIKSQVARQWRYRKRRNPACKHAMQSRTQQGSPLVIISHRQRGRHR